MRRHIIRMLQVGNDKCLPDSHIEGTPLPESAPVRFVWDKTIRQSVHNSTMKERVLSDIKKNRRLYKHVPDREFLKKSVEAAFEQCFTTFRQKYKAQRDEQVAANERARESAKAQKARRLHRKKEVRLLSLIFNLLTWDSHRN